MLRSEADLQLRPWLFTIARNRCLSMLRARRDEVLLDDAQRMPSSRGLAAEVQQREDLREMLGDIRALPEEQRAALLLAELGAQSHEEIGEVLGVNSTKVKALVFQAREALAADRKARETPCVEVRQQLATLRGSALRRGLLRRHVGACAGCRDFQAEVTRQRAAFALLLPVVPTTALKGGVLSAVGITGAFTSATAATGMVAGGSAITGGGIFGGGGFLAGQALATKLVVAAVVAGGVGGGGVVAVKQIRTHPRSSHAVPSPAERSGRAIRLPAAAATTTSHETDTAPGGPGSSAHRARSPATKIRKANKARARAKDEKATKFERATPIVATPAAEPATAAAPSVTPTPTKPKRKRERERGRKNKADRSHGARPQRAPSRGPAPAPAPKATNTLKSKPAKSKPKQAPTPSAPAPKADGGPKPKSKDH